MSEGNEIYRKKIKKPLDKLKKGDKKMNMAFLNEFDKNYPMSINDGWGGKCYISSDILENGKKWNDFINELNKIRNKYLNQKEKKGR